MIGQDSWGPATFVSVGLVFIGVLRHIQVSVMENKKSFKVSFFCATRCKLGLLGVAFLQVVGATGLQHDVICVHK